MCGIVGVYNHNKAATLTANALFALQHRGQESCGIAVSDGQIIKLRKRMGLVKNVFTPEELDKLPGSIAIGHVRYPTRGTATEYNSQPHVVETLSGPICALASNGDIVNYQQIKEDLESKGVFFYSHNDGELLLKYILYQTEKEGRSIVEAIKSLMTEVHGAYSTVLTTRDELIMFRDPYGFRPMSLGRLDDDTYVVASESCGLDILNARFVSWVKPAEIVVVNRKGLHRIENGPMQYRTTDHPKHCIFELIYFSRPDSFQFNEDVYTVRENIGAKLAEMDSDLTPDLVVPVPDSANFIAKGYANAKQMQLTFGLIRNHYVGRTFIKPEQSIRDESVRQKFNVLPHVFKNKSVVLVDDSIVRGTTIKQLIDIIYNAGAKEVHLRIGSPAVKHSCYYGIDTPTEEELIANRMTIEDIVSDFGLTSLKYTPLENLLQCVQHPKDFCHACFSGKYFIPKT